MGIRFRRSIKIAPGVRVNLSKSGVSTTVGPRGASLGLKRGKNPALNVGLGSGLNARYGGGSKPKKTKISMVELVLAVLVVVVTAYLFFR